MARVTARRIGRIESTYTSGLGTLTWAWVMTADGRVLYRLTRIDGRPERNEWRLIYQLRATERREIGRTRPRLWTCLPAWPASAGTISARTTARRRRRGRPRTGHPARTGGIHDARLGSAAMSAAVSGVNDRVSTPRRAVLHGPASTATCWAILRTRSRLWVTNISAKPCRRRSSGSRTMTSLDGSGPSCQRALGGAGQIPRAERVRGDLELLGAPRLQTVAAIAKT